MDNATALKPLIGLTLAQLGDVCAGVGLKPFAARQMARWLYVARVTRIDAMTDLSKSARERLKQEYTVGREAPLESVTSADGTRKYLFRGAPGRDIEAVYIPDGDRATLCVSSQAGCKMNCAFCMTGRQGWHGNLTTAQIVNQVLSIDESASLTNLVFMGMGEPLDNLDNVLPAIEILTAPWGLAWSPRRITLSTIGKLPQMERVITDTQVHMALSVHNPRGRERAAIMPSQRAWPLEDIVQMLKRYDWRHQRRLSVEYIMWDGVNDSPTYARELARTLRGTAARVNLIRFHSIPGSDLRPSPRTRMEAFRDCLNDMGVTATIRASRGEDIMAACGMLAGRDKDLQPSNDTNTD